jgi:predicted nucleotidyltransferase
MSESRAVREQYVEWLRNPVAQRRSSPEDRDRLAHAWQVAHRAVRLLRERYGVLRVRVFGSLLHPERFHDSSDIDLAVEGLAIADYWDALADVLFLDDEIAIDLIDPDMCPADIWARVEREGVEL